MRKIPAALLLLVMASIPLAACGDDDDGGGGGGGGPVGGGGSEEAFCDEARTLDEQFSDLEESDDFDPAVFEQIRDALSDLDPPAELEDDFDTVIDGFGLLIETFEEIDLEDPAALEELEGLEEEFSDTQAAADRIGVYMEEECGIEST